MTWLNTGCIAVAITIAASPALLAAETQADQKEEMEPMLERVDAMSDGRLTEHIKLVVDFSNSYGDFEDYLDDNPQVASEYHRLLMSAARNEDWGAVFVLQTAPPQFLLDTLIEWIRPGGEFRDEFLTKMAARKVSAIGTIWQIFENQSNLEGGYRLYRSYMREHTVEEAAPLIEYLLRASPLTAMDAMLEFYADQLPDAAAVFDDHWTIKKADWMYNHSMHRGDAPEETTDAINRLSRHEVWWVRLYALGAMTERGPFVLRDRVRDLRDGPEDAVSRAANAIGLPGERR